MPTNEVFLTLADGRGVSVNETTPGRFDPPGPTTVTYQFGAEPFELTGSPTQIDVDHPLNPAVSPSGYTIAGPVSAVAQTGGGFEVVYDIRTADSEGIERYFLKGVAVGADASATVNLDTQLDFPTLPVGSASPGPTLLAELPGDRFAVSFATFDANNVATNHVDLATKAGGIYSDTIVTSQPSAITHAAGEVTLTWNGSGNSEREVLDLNGNVLATRGLSNIFNLNASTEVSLGTTSFNPMHDQIRVLNADGTVAGGASSTLTYDARDHTLTWDPDSQGPAPAVQVADFVTGKLAAPDNQAFDVSNLAENFRPAVLKVIEENGTQNLTWFDTTNTQPWDTLHATEDAQGNVLTYGSTSDTGAKEVFNFDVGNLQPWTRYVDEIDVAGHVTQRTVLYDDNTSWTAKYAYSGGQVVSYELDSFDAQGRQVGQSFFNADGTPLGH